MTLTDPAALQEILREAPLLFLAFRAEASPHVVPVCFGVEGGILYVHGAPRGRKIDLLRADPRVGFSACAGATIRTGSSACSYGASGRSIVGTGRARVVEDESERTRGLDAIMRHYEPAWEPAGAKGGGYGAESLSRTCVIAIEVQTLSGKQTGPA